MAPLSNNNFKAQRIKRQICIRPLHPQNMHEFGKVATGHKWKEVLEANDVDVKVRNFHDTIRKWLNQFFPEKSVKISSLDKKWMTPYLKLLLRKKQREFLRHRKSDKWRTLDRKFKKLKRKAVKNFYSHFVSDLKQSNPGKWYEMARRLGSVDQINGGQVAVDDLQGLTDRECAEKIAEHFAAVSNNYQPINLKDLPSYLPAEFPPQVDEYSVFKKLCHLKNTRSTLEIDLPNKVRKEFSAELAKPVTDIINSSLKQQTYPSMWKEEIVTPVPKVNHPKGICDLRKIASTSDFSKVFEAFLKDWILHDIGKNLDPGQYGGLKGTGTDHLLIALVDRVLKLLETNTKSAVLLAMVDWKAAFDLQDPTLAISKFLKMGVRPSLVPLLVSYLSGRQMKVKFNGDESKSYSLTGGGPQGTLLGLIEYLVQSNDNANCINEEDRFKFVDDLSIIELIALGDALVDYDHYNHDASDIGTDERFLQPENFKMQNALNSIDNWTEENLMQINVNKSNYMLISRSHEKFSTRLTLNENLLEPVKQVKLLGVWLSNDLSWDRNTSEVCKRAYARIPMLSKLKYAGVPIDDLINVYSLFIRSVLEYCCTVWHSRLTCEQSDRIERVQKTCLKVILSESYISYDAALEMTGLDSLQNRREERCFSFAKKCLSHPRHSKMFPRNPAGYKEKFVVNFARTETYKKSSVPFMQRMLNSA